MAVAEAANANRNSGLGWVRRIVKVWLSIFLKPLDRQFGGVALGSRPLAVAAR